MCVCKIDRGSHGGKMALGSKRDGSSSSEWTPRRPATRAPMAEPLITCGSRPCSNRPLTTLKWYSPAVCELGRGHEQV